MAGAAGVLLLAACAPTTTAPPPAPRPQVGTPAPSVPPAARTLDRALQEVMAVRLAALTVLVQEELRRQTGNSRLNLEPRDAWVDMVAPGGRSQRFTTPSFNGEQVVAKAVAEHPEDRIAIRVYNPSTGQLVYRGEPKEPYHVAIFEVKGRMGLEVEVTSCKRRDGCAVALGVSVIQGASLGGGSGAPISVPVDPKLLPPDFWR